MRKKKMIYRKYEPESFDGKKWTYKTDEYEVRVMAEADGYAMVRRPYCIPFVARLDQLYPIKHEVN